MGRAAVAAAVALLTGALSNVAFAAASAKQNADSVSTGHTGKDVPSSKNILEPSTSILKNTASNLDSFIPLNSLPQVFEVNAADKLVHENEVIVPGEDTGIEKSLFAQIGKELPPEVAVKTATRMMEEEAERRKKFRNMMKSLVHSDLPQLDPKYDFTPEDSKEQTSIEEDTDPRVGEESRARSMPHLSNILPLLLSRSFQLHSPLHSSILLSPRGPAEENESVTNESDDRKIVISSLPHSFISQDDPRETSPNNPMMVLFPRQSVRIDMTFIPLRRSSITRMTYPSLSHNLKEDTDASTSDVSAHSIRVFSSDSSSDPSQPLPNVSSLPIARFLNFFRDMEEDIIENVKTEGEKAKASKEDSFPISPTQSTRSKREVTTEGMVSPTLSNPAFGRIPSAAKAPSASDSTFTAESDFAVDSGFRSESKPSVILGSSAPTNIAVPGKEDVKVDSLKINKEDIKVKFGKPNSSSSIYKTRKLNLGEPEAGSENMNLKNTETESQYKILKKTTIESQNLPESKDETQNIKVETVKIEPQNINIGKVEAALQNTNLENTNDESRKLNVEKTGAENQNLKSDDTKTETRKFTSEVTKVQNRNLNAEDAKAEPRSFNAKIPKNMRKSTSRTIGVPTLGPFGIGLMEDLMHYHPHTITQFPITEDMKPYFHLLPYLYAGGYLAHDKMPFRGALGIVPDVVTSDIEQQMIAMNQVAHEGPHNGEVLHPPQLLAAPCVPPCLPFPLPSNVKTKRMKRSISGGSPFQQPLGPQPYNGLERQAARTLPNNDDNTDSQFVTEMLANLDPQEPNEEPSVVQSKFFVKGEPEAIRKLNPQIRMSFGSDQSEKKLDSQRDREDIEIPLMFSRGLDKSKTTFLPSKYGKMMFEKKKMKAKKMFAAMKMEPPPSSEIKGAPVFGVNPFVSRFGSSLLSESEVPIAPEQSPFRGKRSIDDVKLIGLLNTEERQPMVAFHDDLLTGEGTGDAYLSKLRFDGKRSKSKTNRFPYSSKTRSKVFEDENRKKEWENLVKNRPNYIPWLDPTEMSDNHDDHNHRQNLANDFKLSSYDH